MLTDATDHAVSRVCRAIALSAVVSVFCVAASAAAQAPASSTSTPPNGGAMWAEVQQQLGGKGTMQPGDVLKFGFPRSDLQVTVDGVKLAPTLALGSWVAFKRVGRAGTALRNVMVMGDLVLTEDEVRPVMLALQRTRSHELSHGGALNAARHHGGLVPRALACSTGTGSIGVPFDHRFTSALRATAKCRCGAVGDAFPVEPT